MKQKLLLISLSILFMSGCQLTTLPTAAPPPPTDTPVPTILPSTPVPPPTEIPETLPAPGLFDTAWEDRSVFAANLRPETMQALDAAPGATIYHMALTISDDLATVTGQVEVRYENREAIPLSEVQFRLFPNILGGKLEIGSTLINGQDVTPGYDLNNSVLRIPLNPPLAPGKQAVIALDFVTTVPAEVELNYGMLSHYGNVLAFAHGYPMVVVYNDEGWNAELPPQAGDIVFHDASFYIVSITAPEELTLVTSGAEIERSENGGEQKVTIVAGPARDFYLAASASFEKMSAKFENASVNIYAPAAERDAASRTLDAALNALRIFSERYSPYPYSELDFVVTPNLALGIEYPGVIAMTERIMLPSPEMGVTQARIYIESVTAHEVAHQWFYNMIGDDQLDEPWLDESLSQFATTQYYFDRYGEEGAQGFRESLQARWERVKGREIPVGMPVRDYSDLEYSAIVYGRGGLFFEALRDSIGQTAFDAFMKDYTNTFSWEIATTEGLKQVAEENCNCDLTPLFAEWIYR